jgi:hypothetical protein
LTVAGFNRPVPVIYGEQRIAGLWLVRPYVKNVSGTDHLRFALLWGWGEIEGVQAVYLNGQTVSGSHMTHYVGTSGQTVNATLAADIAGFNDAYPDWAYTFFSIPAGTYDGFPQTVQIGAVVRGRKVFDPRDSSTAWSENPALCARDFLVSTKYGPGKTVYGTDACADLCDSLVGGVEVRCLSGIILEQPLDLDRSMDLFAAYGEFLWAHDDDGILIVPDTIASVAATLTTDDIIDGTLRLTGTGLDAAPTEVTVNYRKSSGSAVQWPDDSEVVQLAGVDTGIVAAVRSEVSMPALRRGSEARRKGQMRLRRLQHPGRYAWQSFDDGVKFQRGDVVQLPDTKGMSNRVVRILSSDMVGYGRYQHTAEHYSADMYPNDYEPGETTTVPVGGILPYIGTGTPAGYEDFTAANDRFLVGAGDTFARGATFGSTSFTISGTTSEEPAHRYNADFSNMFPTIKNVTGSGSSTWRDVADFAGAHAHSYSVAQNRTPLYAQSKLIKKISAPGDVPANGGVFADGALITTAYEALTTLLGRMNRAGASVGSGGVQLDYSVDVGIVSAGGHVHVSDFFAYGYAIDFTNAIWELVSTNRGAHAHGSSIPVVTSIPRIKLAHYVASSAFEIVPGAIIGYDGDGALPAGWYDCDGLNGTAPIQNRWLERSSPGEAGGLIAGTRKVTWTGNTLSGGQHNHKGAYSTQGKETRLASHDDAYAHTHSLSGEVNYDPPSYAMRFIQYTGVV